MGSVQRPACGKTKGERKMNTEYLEKRRRAVWEQMEEGSIAVIYSGVEIHVSEDEYMDFEVNKDFRYLTDIARDNMALLLDKTEKEPKYLLFIEEADPTMEKWFGKKLTKKEASEISGINGVYYIDSLPRSLTSYAKMGKIRSIYFDMCRQDYEDMPDYNEVKAKEFKERFPGVPMQNLYNITSLLRMKKDEEEVKRIRHAVDMTGKGLEEVMKRLEPGMKEYQAQTIYEATIKYLGSSGPSFPTIAGSGYNGTMLHYETNQCDCEDGSLLLLDLGSKADGWCSDITRTYPVNGKYTERQKAVYDVVLAANRKVAESAKPGMTLGKLNEICEEVLAEGCKKLGLIKENSELEKYYMHGVSHHVGLDVHDCYHSKGKELVAGCVITNEPGLYIEEESIGIRIEDDLLITETGCEVLSKDIIKTTEEIEAFMANHKVNK